MEKTQINHLLFDSALFHYPVGKIHVGKDWNENAFLEQTNAYQLIYIFSENPLALTNTSIELLDTKITYKKIVSSPGKTPSGIVPYRGEMNENLLRLALDSGVHSRFKLDSRLTQNEFVKLYELWIKKSLDAGNLLVADNLHGFVSYDLQEERASIGLIAVSKECRVQGWGKKLMEAAELKASNLGAKTITVSTQEGNEPACKLYESYGYEIVEKIYVYHYWRK